MVSQLNITREIFFFRNRAVNEVGRLVPDFFLFFKRLIRDKKKSKWSAA